MRADLSRVVVCAAAIGVLAAGGCTYEKVVYRRPMLSGLPGATTGGNVSDHPRGYIDPTAVQGGKITLESDDGSKVLVARTARHLMAHIYNTLRNDERELFTEQVLSDVTKQEFRARNLDPAGAFDQLKARQPDIEALFGRMPMGEYTPGMLLRKVGDGTYRLKLTDKAADGLYWAGFDMVMEGGSWRLRWFVPIGA